VKGLFVMSQALNNDEFAKISRNGSGGSIHFWSSQEISKGINR
jgi:hypothetical protein